MTEDEVLGIYRAKDALWFYDYQGDPKAPHAELTSGLCSDGYINSAPVMSDPELARRLAWELVVRLVRQNIYPDWVLGSAYAAITFSYEVARQIGARHGFVEKDPQNPKKMVWSRFVIPAGAIVLQCEELITTMGTTEEVYRAVTEGNPRRVIILQEVITAIYRPSTLVESTGWRKIIPLATKTVQSWKPEDCPLCRFGSPRVRPKSHWAELTGKSA